MSWFVQLITGGSASEKKKEREFSIIIDHGALCFKFHFPVFKTPSLS